MGRSPQNHPMQHSMHSMDSPQYVQVEVADLNDEMNGQYVIYGD